MLEPLGLGWTIHSPSVPLSLAFSFVGQLPRGSEKAKFFVWKANVSEDPVDGRRFDRHTRAGLIAAFYKASEDPKKKQG